jgi:hypothetical protein
MKNFEAQLELFKKFENTEAFSNREQKIPQKLKKFDKSTIKGAPVTIVNHLGMFTLLL